MTRIGWEKSVNDLRQEVTLIRSRARICSGKFQELRRQVECCKVQFLTYQLEVKRKSLARSRGVKNGKGLPAALGIAAAASILTGIMRKDRFAAANAGLSRLNGALQRLGETDWAICLGKQLAVVSQNDITSGRVWLTWDSVRAALNELEQRAQNGAHLGNIDAVFLEMRRSKRLVTVIMQTYKIIT